ncbi:MAG: amidohydrolase [Oscillospiraceae bacterium]|nr:amidohydrolase [Oscillospiraceae bacterium]
MTIKLYNAKILNRDFSVTENGTVLVKDGIIQKVCDHVCKNNCSELLNQSQGQGFPVTSEGSEGRSAFKEIDCKGGLLMPSFKNAHTHSAMTFLRSRADDLPLHEWLHKQVFPQEGKLTPDDVYWFTKLAVLEYLSGGTTAAFDMYMAPESVANAAVDTGFRFTLCGSVMDFDGDDGVARMCDCYERFNKFNPLVAYNLGFHAEYTNKIENLRELAEVVAKYESPIFCHMSETKSEHEGCIERHGKSPARLFEEIGMWEHGGGAFHAVHVDDDDMDIMAKRGIYAISNPGSNLKLASGIAPLMKMAEKGIKIALGTDGAASNNALSMFREMYFACTLQKHLMNDAAACSAYDALRWAMANSAESFGLKDADCIEVGKKADMVLIDLDLPSMRPHNNIVKNIVYSGDTSVVRMTMVNGEVRYKDGEFFLANGEDASAVIEKCEKLMARFA